MEPRLIALQLFLDQLGVSHEIGSLEDRVRVQKAVYLGQLSGVDLGYRFSWYLRGPYSSKLTKDYYEVKDAITTGEVDYKKMVLKPSISEKLSAVSPLLKKPETIPLENEAWLELVASYHYLRKVGGYSHDEALTTFEKEKSHLVKFVSVAKSQLEKFNLLS